MSRWTNPLTYRRMLMLALLVFAAPAFAQQKVNPDAVEKLLQSCVGSRVSYAPYFNDALSYDDCLSTELNTARTNGRQLTSSIQSDLKRCEFFGVSGGTTKQSLKKLISTTRAWPQIVDDQCDVVLFTFGQGSEAGREYARCRIAMYLTRNEQLMKIQQQIKNNKTAFSKTDPTTSLICK